MNRLASAAALISAASVLVSLSPSGVAFAQTGLDYVAADLTIVLSPEHPDPGATVRASAESSSLDLNAGTLTWSVDGKQVKGTSPVWIEVTAGALGSETTVTAVASEGGTRRASASVTIRPSELALLWESDSFTPPFYRGRALPSAGTRLRLQALAHFVRPGGSLVRDQDIRYTWRRNGYVIAGVSGLGRSRAVIDAPPLFGTDTISVQAESSDGLLSDTVSVRIPSIDPILKLYQNHPLFGVLFGEALGPRTNIPDIEMSFSAVPYFAQAHDANDPSLSYAWRVNGEGIVNDPDDPSEITINAQNSSGAALIELALTSPVNFFLQSEGSWSAYLQAGDAGSPFRASAQSPSR